MATAVVAASFNSLHAGGFLSAFFISTFSINHLGIIIKVSSSLASDQTQEIQLIQFLTCSP